MTVRHAFERRGIDASYSFAVATNDGATPETQMTVSQYIPKEEAWPGQIEVIREG